jgi:hypothetical protein
VSITSDVALNKIRLAFFQQPQIDEATLIAMQQHMAQQAAFAQIPDVVKGVRYKVFCCHACLIFVL